jgi:hypothetical protein
MGTWDLMWPTLIRQNNIVLTFLPASEVENMHVVSVYYLEVWLLKRRWPNIFVYYEFTTSCNCGAHRPKSQARSIFREDSFRVLPQNVIHWSFMSSLWCIEMVVLLPIIRKPCLARVKATHRDYLAPCIAFWVAWVSQRLCSLILKSKATDFHLCEMEFFMESLAWDGPLSKDSYFYHDSNLDL